MARTKATSSTTITVSKKGGKPRSKSVVAKKPKSDNLPIQKKRKSDESEKKERKKRRNKPGTKAKRDRKRYQKSVELMIQKKPFENLVREVMQEFNDRMRIQPMAVRAIQEGIENFIIDILEGTNELCRIGKRKSPTAKILRTSALPYFNNKLPPSAEEKAEAAASKSRKGKK